MPIPLNALALHGIRSTEATLGRNFLIETTQSLESGDNAPSGFIRQQRNNMPVKSSIQDLRHRIGQAPMPTPEVQEILCIVDQLAEHIAALEDELFTPYTHAEIEGKAKRK